MNIPSISSVRSVSAATLLVLATTGVVVPTAGIANNPSTPFDRAPWIADFDILRDAMTRNYANLEWARERGMDLAATEQRARMRLQSASNEYQARIAFDRFIAAFGDGHLQLKWPDPVSAAASPEPAGFCQRMGYRDDQDDGAVAAFLPDYEPLDPGHPLGAGIVTTNGTSIAVLRIDEFGPSGTECEAARAELRLPADKECDEGCGDAVRTKADSLFVTGMERRLRALATRQPDFLLIDLASNGGGNDSAIALARMLDAHIPTPAIGRMRGAALQGDLTSSRNALRAALEGASRADAHDLRSVDAGLKTRIVEAGKPCDRSGLWKNQHISCSGLVRGQFFAGGYTATPITSKHAGGAVLSVIASYRFASGIWSRPVAVLVDGNTASAAELAPAMLQDRKRAVIVGSPTFGAGCGWMLELQPITLPNSGGRIVMPDCSRFRSDGSNEVDGITPDVAVSFRRFDTREQRVERLKRALPSLIERLSVARRSRASEF